MGRALKMLPMAVSFSAQIWRQSARSQQNMQGGHHYAPLIIVYANREGADMDIVSRPPTVGPFRGTYQSSLVRNTMLAGRNTGHMAPITQPYRVVSITSTSMRHMESYRKMSLTLDAAAARSMPDNKEAQMVIVQNVVLALGSIPHATQNVPDCPKAKASMPYAGSPKGGIMNVGIQGKRRGRGAFNVVICNGKPIIHPHLIPPLQCTALLSILAHKINYVSMHAETLILYPPPPSSYLSVNMHPPSQYST